MILCIMPHMITIHILYNILFVISRYNRLHPKEKDIKELISLVTKCEQANKQTTGSLYISFNRRFSH